LGFEENSARAIASPREGTFFQLRYDTRKRDHGSIMRAGALCVNGVTSQLRYFWQRWHFGGVKTACVPLESEKKPGP
jgi:hypothetical protein